MHAKNLCHLVSNESFNKTANCIKDMIVKDVTAKIMPPPLDCLGTVKKYCLKKHHPTILGWIEFFLKTMLDARNGSKDLKDKFGNGLEAKWNAYAVIQKFFGRKCKADTAFAGKFKMITA